jgi:hypothetical protein
LVEIADGAEAEAGSINRARLRVDTRKWVAAKLRPRRYGDRTAVDLNANVTLRSLILESMSEVIEGEVVRREDGENK